MSKTYIQLDRDLLRDERILALPPSYRCVLWTILDHCCFSECVKDDHGVQIFLKPGQFLCTIRHLAELANVGKKDAEHAIKKLIAFGVLGQEVGHKKSIFTILWGINFDYGGTTNGTKPKNEKKVGQDWDKLSREENDQDFQKVGHKRTKEVFCCFIYSCLEKISDPSISEKEKIRITKKYSEEIVSNAVKVIMEPNFEIDGTLLKALNAACKGEWKPKKKKEEDFEKNKKLATMLEGERNNYRFEALSKKIEIIKGMISECVDYAMPYKKFYSKVEQIGKINIKQEIAE